MTHLRFVPSSLLASLIPSVTALVLFGCPGDDSAPIDETSSGPQTSSSGGNECTPGQQISCPCPGGVEGTQVCRPDGSGFGLCECDTPDGSGTTTTGIGTSSSSGPGSSTSTGMATGDTGTTGTTDTGGSTDSTTTGGASVCDMYMGTPGMIECDQWLQDCPAGEKCMPWDATGGGSWNATRCSPVDPVPDQVGDSCTVVGSGTSGVDSCDLGLMCWDVDPETNIGECIELCSGCPDEPFCNGPGTACVVTNDDILLLCLDVCDPLLQDCVAGQACYPVADVFLCAPDASGVQGAYGDPCEFINVCDPGLACLSAAQVPGCFGVGCCSEFCDVSDPAGDAQCMGMGGGQTCQPWYPVGMAPPGYEDVGICTL